MDLNAIPVEFDTLSKTILTLLKGQCNRDLVSMSYVIRKIGSFLAHKGHCHNLSVYIISIDTWHDRKWKVLTTFHRNRSSSLGMQQASLVSCSFMFYWCHNVICSSCVYSTALHIGKNVLTIVSATKVLLTHTIRCALILTMSLFPLEHFTYYVDF